MKHVLFLLCLQPLYSMVNAGVEVDADDYYDGPVQVVVWEGPGWYYGIWFDDEVEYNNWYYGHYYHHDGHWQHGGGGHHGGSHGGGGHGGHGGGHR